MSLISDFAMIVEDLSTGYGPEIETTDDDDDDGSSASDELICFLKIVKIH